MAGNLNIEDLRAALASKQATWTAAHTRLSNLDEHEKRRRLGAMPPDGHSGLQRREADAAHAYAAMRTRTAQPGAAAAPGYPAKWTWRDAAGSDYMTAVRNQDACGACVAFGTLAALEAKIRIDLKQPTLQVDLSEAQLFFCDAASEGRNCDNGWWPDHALRFLVGSGVADEACFAYSPHDQPCRLSGDAGVRSAFVSRWRSLSHSDDMKDWLSKEGPLIACFSVYEDFFLYPGGVYHHVAGTLLSGHCVCVVGYDDTQQCWICKNSWGDDVQEQGYFRIRYGDCGIDAEMWAIEGVMFNKVTLADTSNVTPALAVHDGRLALAWTGRDRESHLNVMVSSDAYHFTGKVTLGETSIDGPGLAAGKGRLYLAWTGVDPAHHLNVLSSTDGQNFGNKVTLGDTASFGPALAFMHDTLYLAWVGTDPGRSLNVMSSNDGIHWRNKVTLRENSDGQVALCAANGLLYLIWQGTDPGSHLNLLESNDGRNWGNKITLGDRSWRAPSAACTDKLVLAWTGCDPNRSLNRMTSSSGSHGFGNKITFEDNAVSGTALVGFNGGMYLAWSGTDPEHHLNLMRVHT